MKPGDKLIVAGVALVPFVISVVLAIQALFGKYDREGAAAFAAIWLGVAAAAGLITTGILLRKQP